MSKGSITLKEYGKELRAQNPELFDRVQVEVRAEFMINKTLSELRKNENITQQELADILNVSQAMIGKFEAGGSKNPTIKFLTKIADALGYTMYITFEKK